MHFSEKHQTKSTPLEYRMKQRPGPNPWGDSYSVILIVDRWIIFVTYYGAREYYRMIGALGKRDMIAGSHGQEINTAKSKEPELVAYNYYIKDVI